MQGSNVVTKPSKQRKAVFQAADHLRYKLFAAPLSPELKGRHVANALPVKNGDTVRIMRGDHKGFEGKISRVDRARYRIYIEGLTREKVDGTAIFVPMHPSKVMITSLSLDDKWRRKILERKKGIGKRKEEMIEKPLEITPIKEVTETKIEQAEKLEEKKPRARRRRVARKAAAKAEKLEEPKEEKKEEAKPMKKPRVKKTRTRQKADKKPEGEE